ncbi:hypothetical protein BLA39750_02611 [Burkholderia lata]|uniref:Lipoprotein n=1 Tax=Burkholderia lata (strain ATCC 17760 / DSM 23089 / LMG 22485 / NCIMB 9086 / R18194 / 383) TaxID=482957 RepID=A0A6P2WY25_BURL3|nr:hypothetical protein [Burkholderia lata]VWD01702.1 hypothetical protein BLA39750_02611 [Burkholderia lata]
MSLKFGEISFRAVSISLGIMLAACGRHDTPVIYSPAGQFTSITVPRASLPPDADAQVRAQVNNVLHEIEERAQGQSPTRGATDMALGQNTFLTVVRSPDDMQGFKTTNFDSARMPSDVNPGPDDVALVISHRSVPGNGYVDTVQTVPDAPNGSDSLTLRITSTKVQMPGMVIGAGYFDNNVFVVKRGKASKLILSLGDAQQAYELGPAAR